jgi:hypothetical protein
MVDAMSEKASLSPAHLEHSEQVLELLHHPTDGVIHPACAGDPDPSQGNDPNRMYRLPGPQVEPEAGWWTDPPTGPQLHVVAIEDVLALTQDSSSELYVPPYPRDSAVLDWEIAELAYLQERRDQVGALDGTFPMDPPAALDPIFRDTQRDKLSDFIHLDPPPFGAIFNVATRPQYGIHNVNQQHLRRQFFRAGLLPPVVQTGRQLARLFENETPGLIHRHTLNYLLYKRSISPPRQARVWMALDITIYSALIAAWYYKWRASTEHYSYRQRPYEYDRNQHFRVLFDDVVDDVGLFDKCPRPAPCPSPGTPRHPAYPSGHSTFSAAASAVLAYFFPEEKQQLEMLANNIGTARLWAGVHWRSDHIAGQRVGRAVARRVIEQLQGDCIPSLAQAMQVTQPPDPAALAMQAANRRTGTDCVPTHDELPTQRSAPFSDC